MFSQRSGFKLPKEIQLNSMDEELRNGLWNAVKIYVIDLTDYSGTRLSLFSQLLWHFLYKRPIDRIPHIDGLVTAEIRKRFFSCPWFEVYDFLEWLINIDHSVLAINKEGFIDFCNGALESEFSAYRIVADKIAPITNENEIVEVESAFNITTQFTSFSGANVHLHKALENLSDKTSPDYRNSIKESVCALESVVKAIAGSKKDTLAGALTKLKGLIDLHPALESGYKSIYGYTSDGGGIRHALMDNSTVTFEDAKYMFVSFSAFINYLIVKTQKAGIPLA